MGNNNYNLKEAVDFHGHLGPYLVLGLICGNILLKKTGIKKHFGLLVKVYGANRRPKSCLIDGLQLSTGATFGKGNIQKQRAKKIKVVILDPKNRKKISATFTKQLLLKLDSLNTHIASENFAKSLLNINYKNLFIIKEE